LGTSTHGASEAVLSAASASEATLSAASCFSVAGSIALGLATSLRCVSMFAAPIKIGMEHRVHKIHMIRMVIDMAWMAW
jgi:hypothetical protein